MVPKSKNLAIKFCECNKNELSLGSRRLSFSFSGSLRADRRFRRHRDCEQQELQPLEQEIEVVAGCCEYGVDGIAKKCPEFFAHSILG